MEDLKLETRKKLKDMGLRSYINHGGEFYNCVDVATFFEGISQKLSIATQTLAAIDAFITMKHELNEEDFNLILRDVRSALGNIRNKSEGL